MFSIAHRHKNLQNVFRYHYHHENPGIPAHAHVDPADVDIYDITSSLLDLSDGYRLLTPYQLVNNNLFTFKSTYLTNDLKLSLHIGHFINNLQEFDKWTRHAFDLNINQNKFYPNVKIRREMEEYESILSSKKIRDVLGFNPVHDLSLIHI